MVDQTADFKKFLPWLATVAVLIVTVELLHLEGRLWICSCGFVLLWAGKTCSSNNSQHFLDPYSFTHLLHGFLYFWLIALTLKRLRPKWQLWLAITLAAAWEVFENSNFVINRYRTETAALGYSGDTIVNSVGDILCVVVGFLIARRVGLRGSVLTFAVIELVLLLWIKDSLLLQILMLVHPIKVIKVWQMCK